MTLLKLFSVSRHPPPIAEFNEEAIAVAKEVSYFVVQLAKSKDPDKVSE